MGEIQQADKPATPEEFFAIWEEQQEPAESTSEEQQQPPQEEVKAQQEEPQAPQGEIEALRQQLAALQQENDQIKQLLLQQQPQQQEEQQVQMPPQDFTQKVLESLPKEQREQLEQLYYEDPLKAVAQVTLIVNAAYQQHVAAEAKRKEEEIRQQRAALEREYMMAAKELQELYGVDDNALSEIVDLISKEKRDLLTLPARQALREGYEFWKRKKGVNEITNAVMQAFKNPQVLTEALKDPQVLGIVAQALKPEVVKTAAETNAGVPVLLANQPGGVAAATPPQKPRSAKEAMQMWLAASGS